MLPTRVLEVGLGKESKTLRLVQTNGQSERYITLSHCWGTVRPLTTTKQNLCLHLRHIDFDTLPLTFKHAVFLARHLRIQYLCIDSLCIIQDDADDWLKESGKMSHVFENALFTIAASSATDISKGYGFLSNERIIPPTLRMLDTNENVEFFIHDYSELWRDVERSVLNARAWVPQERLLSRSTVHFTSAEMYWECSSCVSSEKGQNFTYQALRLHDEVNDKTHFDSIPGV